MTVSILKGDCRQVMFVLGENVVDSIVTDPPYELTSARPGGRSEATRGKVMGGFMGMQWDGTGVAFDPETWRQALRVLKPGGYLLAFSGTRTYHRMVVAIEDAGFEIRDQIGWAFGSGFPKSHNGPWGGTALKPAWEPIVVARKPLVGTVEANWREHGTGALNIDACRVGDATGRWPANLIHDGSDEVLHAFPEAPGQQGRARTDGAEQGNNTFGALKHITKHPEPRIDSGSAARFFYCAKASKTDRGDGNNHPTVKPSSLMRYLCRLVTPDGGLVLDPFMGSGSTLKAAELEGFNAIGIELSPEYIDIARRRIGADAPLFMEPA